MKAVIVDYGSGNLRSAAKALERAAPADVSVEVSADAASLDDASHVGSPGTELEFAL